MLKLFQITLKVVVNVENAKEFLNVTKIKHDMTI